MLTKCVICTHDKSIAIKAPAHDNHRLLLYHNNRFLQYEYHTTRLSEPPLSQEIIEVF